MISLKAIRRFLFLPLLVIPACAPIASMKVVKCPYHPVHGASSVAAAQKCLETEPERALGEYLEAALASEQVLKATPKDETARKDYNFAVARAVEALSRSHLDAVNGVVTIPSDTGDFSVTAKLPPGVRYKLRDVDFYASDTVVIGGKYFMERPTIDGVGAPFAAITKEEKKDFRKDFGWKHDFGAVTVVIRFSGPNMHRAQIEFIPPLQKDKVELDGTTYTLAADFNAPIAIIMARERPEKLGLARLLRPEKYADTARLMRLQAYDPNRIPVIFIHGLQDTPASWAPMVNAMRSDPELRTRYQFWVYSYPSGYPYPYSASLLRKELDGVDKAFPGHKPIVLVGHSMGGMVSRLMITDSGDKIWVKLFGKPPAQTHLAGASRELLEQCVIFEHRKDVGRVIFMCAPHQGSNLATIWIGRLASSLVHAPRFLAEATTSVTSALTLDRSALKLSRMPNSIDTLSPNNRFVRAVKEIPITPGIPYHSIIGDRGKGDTPDSSDGVVPYWSSHLDGAQSEKIVPCGHGSPRNPEAIEEVKRILKLNLGK